MNDEWMWMNVMCECVWMNVNECEWIMCEWWMNDNVNECVMWM